MDGALHLVCLTEIRQLCHSWQSTRLWDSLVFEDLQCKASLTLENSKCVWRGRSFLKASVLGSRHFLSWRKSYVVGGEKEYC